MEILTKILELIKSSKGKVFIFLIFSLIGIWFIVRPKPKLVETAEVEHGVYREFLSEEGIAYVKERFTIFSPVNGVLRRIEKHVGDSIQKGEVIAEVDWDIVRKIRSPITGKILKVFRDSAGPVSMEEKLMDLGDTSKMEVKIDVLTEDTAELGKGDKVSLTGFGDISLSGTVRLVEPSAITKVSSLGVEEQRVVVWVDINPPPGLGDGYKLNAKVLLFEKPDAILVPSSSLFRIGEKWAVYVVEKNRAKIRICQISFKSEGIAKVEKGLSVGEVVILFPGDSIKEGTKVKEEVSE
jgi:HlyD family secretion protein